LASFYRITLSSITVTAVLLVLVVTPEQQAPLVMELYYVHGCKKFAVNNAYCRLQLRKTKCKRSLSTKTQIFAKKEIFSHGDSNAGWLIQSQQC
jgi:hypothetical protein